MKLLLIHSAGTEKQLLQAVLTELQSVDGPLSFSLESEPLNLPDGNSFADFFESLKRHRARTSLHEGDFLGLLTKRANDCNWFSAFDEEEHNFFVHSEGWDYIMPCLPEIPIAYQVLANFLQKLTYGSLKNLTSCAHQRPIGCINDMCGWKPDLSLGIRTGDICKVCCETSLNQDSVNENLLEQVLGILNNLRKKALFSYDFGVVGYEDLPSPVAYTKAKLLAKSDPKLRFECLINHFDSLMKTTVQVTGRVLLGSNFNEFLGTPLAQKLQEKPALGDWVAAIKKISTEGSGESPEVLGLPKDLRKAFKDAGREVDLGQIVKIRNELLGHGYAQDGTEEYEKAYEKCSPHIRKIEKLLQPILTCISLRHVKRAYPVDEQKACVEYQELVGDHPDIFQERKVELSLDESKLPIAERIYGRTPNDKWHDLHDSLVLQKCGECKRKRLLISDGKYYLDSYGGHRFPKPKAVR